MGTSVTFSNPVLRQKGFGFITLTASKTFVEGDSGGTYGIASDSLVMTLPLISTQNIGMKLTFINTGADGNNIITIASNSSDAFHGGVVTSTGLNADATTSEALMGWASGALDKDYVLTKTTSNKGDFVILQAAALTHWQIIGGAGTWKSQT